MAEWWKNLTDALARPSDEAAGRQRSTTLKERVDREKEKLREQEMRTESRSRNGVVYGGGGTVRDPGEAELQEDLHALRALVGWKLGVQVKDIAGNPSKIDGYWFGVRRYIKEKPASKNGGDSGYEPCWTLHFFRQCPSCKFLFPTLELGNYSEALEAATAMMAGKDAEVSRSTEKLAAYLNDREAGRPDEFCPRQCPSCRKLIRGGTQ